MRMREDFLSVEKQFSHVNRSLFSAETLID